MTNQVFISYSSKDKKMADAVCHYLEQERIRCWIAPRDVKLGMNFADEIVDSIPKSNVMIVILSANSNTSRQVLRELELAIQNDIVVIPVRIEDILPTGGMSYYLSTMQWIDIIDNKTDINLSLLAQRIKNILDVVEDDKIQGKKEVKVPELIKIIEKPRIVNKKRLVIIFSSIVLIVAVGLALFLMRDTIFKNNSPSSTTETPTSNIVLKPEDMELDPKMVVNIEDATLRESILFTLDYIKKPVDGEITVMDMFNLEYLKIASLSEIDLLDERVLDDEYLNDLLDGIIATDDTIESLEGLQYGYNIKDLMVAGKEIRDISFLENLTNLERIDLTNNRISDISKLEKLVNLKTLILSNNLIIDLSPLETMIKLTELGLNQNLISNIEPLKKLINMKGIVLNDNDISDISALSEMRFLYGIGLNSNKLEDISALASMRKAKWLLLRNNRIRDISALSELKELESLIINNNYIDDISPIENLSLGYLLIDQNTYDNNPNTIKILEEKDCQIDSN